MATSLNEAGALPSPRLSIYTRGESQQVELISFVITEEPSVPADRTDETCDLLADAFDALRGGHGVEAEKLLREAMAREPDAPDVLNNLAMAFLKTDLSHD